MRLVDTVIDFLYWQVIYSSILFICILPVCLAIKRTSPYWLYYIWFLVPLRLIVPPDYALSFSIRSAIDRISEIFQRSAAEPLSGSGYSAAGNYVNTHLIDSVPHAEWTASILVLLWFTGLLIMSVRFYGMHRYKHRILKNSIPVTNRSLTNRLNILRSIHHVHRKVLLISGKEGRSPFTSGVLHPVIYIPDSLLTTASRETLDTCIAHEIVHIKRLDNFWLNIQHFLQTVYFFHPVIWLCNYQIDKHREQICDYEVLRTGIISSDTYINSMLEVVGRNMATKQRSTAEPAFGLQYKLILQRINLIKESKDMKAHYQKSAFLITALAAVFLLPMASFSKPVTYGGGELSSILGHMSAPVKQGRITARYGLIVMPVGNEKGKEHFHRGIDIAAKTGTPIYAISGGKVEIAVDDFQNSKNPAYGKYLKISHGSNIQSVYLHMDDIFVANGQDISAGQKIGSMGNTGLSTGPHLHMELYVDGVIVNPEQYIKFDL